MGGSWTGSKIRAMAWVSKYISPLIASTGRVLEVGCGRGVLLVELARAHVRAKVVGVDACETRLRQARKRCVGFPNVCLQLASAASLPFPDDSFDLVYSRFAIERLQDKARAVAEIARVCRPGGTVLLRDRIAPVWYNLTPPAPNLFAFYSGR